MNTSVARSTFTTLSNHHLCLVPEHFYLPKRRPILLSSYSPAPGNHQFAFCLSGFICLVWTFHIKWGHTLGGLSCLASFTQQSLCHPWCAVSVLSSFLWFDDILRYGWTASCSSIHPLMDICLHLLGFVNRATVNTLFMYLLEYLFPVAGSYVDSGDSVFNIS